ncbi:hypothetical protein [Nocardia africana]
MSTASVGKWKQVFLEPGTKALDEVPSGPAGAQGPPEQRRLRMENEQLALAEATVQLRVWQHGAAWWKQVPRRPRGPESGRGRAGFEVRTPRSGRCGAIARSRR